MTPQYVLRVSLCREPHCFRAHVPGRGYVNDGSVIADNVDGSRSEFLRQYWRTALADIENLQWSPGYAEPGYDEPKRGVLLANWNHFARDIDRVLERMGFAIEWEDEWSTCSDCYKVFRTSPDSMCWTPSYVMGDGEIWCKECAPKSEDEDE
jgi:hypothetical protein